MKVLVMSSAVEAGAAPLSMTQYSPPGVPLEIWLAIICPFQIEIAANMAGLGMGRMRGRMEPEERNGFLLTTSAVISLPFYPGTSSPLHEDFS